MKRLHRIVIFSLLIILTIIFIHYCQALKFIQDDAYTTFRYVRNFLNGKGLVFNPGEYVEGYTNFLWIVILSLIGFVHFDYVSISQYLSIGFGILILFETYLISINVLHFKNKIAAKFNLLYYFDLIPVLLLVFSVGFIYWAVSGMETSLFIFLILSGIYFYIKDDKKGKPNYKFSFAFLLASLTRPEGVFLFILFYLHKLFFIKKHKLSEDKNIFYYLKNVLLRELGAFVIPYSIYLLFRITYYGYIFPNTFYAKVGFSSFYLIRGFKYFLYFAKSDLLYGSILILPLLLYKFKDLRNQLNLFYFIITTYIMSIIFIGGDVLPMDRFFLPILPLIFILFGKFFQVFGAILYENYNKIFSTAIIFIVLISNIFIGHLTNKFEIQKAQKWRGYERGLVFKMRIYANWVNRQQAIKNRIATVAISTIGSFSFYSGARIIDLIGLTNEYIAHHPKEVPGIAENVSVLWREKKYNVDYVLSRKPDYIIFPAGAKPSAYPEAALFSKKDFLNNYYTQLFYSNRMSQLLPIFTKKSKLQLMENKQNLSTEICNVKFVGNYIDANGLFLKFLKTGNYDLVKSIIKKSLLITKECPLAADKAYTTIGYTLYFAGDIKTSEKYFLKAVKINPLNSIAHFYLQNIYFELGDKTKGLQQIKILKKISPDAEPYLF